MFEIVQREPSEMETSCWASLNVYPAASKLVKSVSEAAVGFVGAVGADPLGVFGAMGSAERLDCTQ